VRGPVLTCAIALLTVGVSALGRPAAAQGGAGDRTAGVLQLPGGGRAAGMAGAYAAGGDADALFYNPASAGWLDAAAGLTYQRHLADIGFATAAGAIRLGPLALALTIGFLDYGTIADVRPDPDYGGQRGRETGETWGASEAAVRGTLAVPLLGDRLTAGASAGVLFVGIAETGRTTPVFDAGLQYRASPDLTIGAALRNAGGDLEGAGLAGAPLPTEVRLGTAWRLPFVPREGTRVAAHLDLVAPLRDGDPAAAIGAELRHVVGSGRVAAALRAGYDGTTGSGGLGRLHVGGGLELDRFALDYALQDMDLFGVVHRFGVRWSR
jgi:hypothetical protein